MGRRLISVTWSVRRPSSGNSPLVERPTGNDDSSSNHHQGGKHIHRPRGKQDAPTTLGNPLHHHPRLSTNKLKSTLRQLECQQDIPISWRINWVQDATPHYTEPKQKVAITQCIKRLRRSGKQPKYPVFYNIQPLVKLAFTGPAPQQIGDKLDRLLLQVRITTLMRSGDAANIVWAVFTNEGNHYIKTTNKSGQVTTFNITGQTLQSLLDYLHHHKEHPAPFLFRYTKQPENCLGSDRLANRLLQLMQKNGIDTTVYKAHSLRGATAHTHAQTRHSTAACTGKRGMDIHSHTGHVLQ